jgi:hypothetical protein
MFKKVNCRWAENPGGWCKNKLIKRSLLGIGARCCVKYYDDDKECIYHSPFDRPPTLPPRGPLACATLKINVELANSN